MTLPLPRYDGNNLQAILDIIAKSAIDTGERSIKLRWGSSSATYTAAATSAQVTIPHGMGSVPVALFLSLKQPQNGLHIPYENAAADATNVYVILRQAQNTAVSVTQNFYWIAIG